MHKPSPKKSDKITIHVDRNSFKVRGKPVKPTKVIEEEKVKLVEQELDQEIWDEIEAHRATRGF